MVVQFRKNTSLAFGGISRFACGLIVILLSLSPVSAIEGAPFVPAYGDPRERIALPDLSDRPRIRFLVSTDFPPFSFMDQTGKLAGFHVDLVRILCESLDVIEKCQIQAVPFDEMAGLLLTGQAEAAAAGMAVNAKARERFAFTRAYLELPARFAVKKGFQSGGDEGAAKALAGKRVGVMENSAHEALLRSWFPDMRPVVFSREEWLREALKKGTVDAVLADGLRLSFFLASPVAEDCCVFFDGPFLAREFLGEGLSIAAAAGSRDIIKALDHALQDAMRNGRFAELYLRWFPEGLY